MTSKAEVLEYFFFRHQHGLKSITNMGMVMKEHNEAQRDEIFKTLFFILCMSLS